MSILAILTIAFIVESDRIALLVARLFGYDG